MNCYEWCANVKPRYSVNIEAGSNSEIATTVISGTTTSTQNKTPEQHTRRQLRCKEPVESMIRVGTGCRNRFRYVGRYIGLNPINATVDFGGDPQNYDTTVLLMGTAWGTGPAPITNFPPGDEADPFFEIMKRLFARGDADKNPWTVGILGRIEYYYEDEGGVKIYPFYYRSNLVALQLGENQLTVMPQGEAPYGGLNGTATFNLWFE